jgi:hypothetical protein
VACSLTAREHRERLRPLGDQFVYGRGPDGTFRAHAIQVLTITDTGIARIVAFANPALFGPFGLPPHLPPRP